MPATDDDKIILQHTDHIQSHVGQLIQLSDFESNDPFPVFVNFLNDNKCVSSQNKRLAIFLIVNNLISWVALVETCKYDELRKIVILVPLKK